ncbi:MAG: sialidase family protein [Lentisphaeria bacterium]|jgi:predicted neuraminidase
MSSVFTMLQEMFVTPPAPGHSHASTLLALPDGGVLAAWFAGSREGANDVRIQWSRFEPATARWSPPEEISSGAHLPHWNPVLGRMPSGRVVLFFKVGATIADWRTYVCEYDQSKQSWSRPAELIAGDDSGGRGPVKNKPIILSNGWVLAPGSTECDSWRPFVDISRDDGHSWQKVAVELPTAVVDYKYTALGLIQPALWESAPGKVHMLLRSNAGRVYRSDSEDFGLSWSLPTATAQPNNNSGLDLLRLADGRLLLAANRDGRNWGRRDELYLYLSNDNGLSWPETQSLTLSDGEASKSEYPYTPGDGEAPTSEYSYPAIIGLSDGTVALSYTWRRQCIRFQQWRID